jgi:hypothetical protein
MTQNTRKHARANCHRHRKPVESHSADVPNATIIKAAVPTVGTTRRSNASSAPTAPPAKQKAPENQALCQIPTLHRQSPLQAKQGRIQTTTACQPVSSEWENQAMSDIMSHTEPNTELKISLALFSVVFFFIPTKHPYFSPIAASRSRDAPQPAYRQHTHTLPQRPKRRPPSAHDDPHRRTHRIPRLGIPYVETETL